MPTRWHFQCQLVLRFNGKIHNKGHFEYMTLINYLPCFMSTVKCHFNEILQTNKVDSPTSTFRHKFYIKSRHFYWVPKFFLSKIYLCLKNNWCGFVWFGFLWFGLDFSTNSHYQGGWWHHFDNLIWSNWLRWSYRHLHLDSRSTCCWDITC